MKWFSTDDVTLEDAISYSQEIYDPEVIDHYIDGEITLNINN